MKIFAFVFFPLAVRVMLKRHLHIFTIFLHKIIHEARPDFRGEGRVSGSGGVAMRQCGADGVAIHSIRRAGTTRHRTDRPATTSAIMAVAINIPMVSFNFAVFAAEYYCQQIL